jgi:phosphohistidine phosphatase
MRTLYLLRHAKAAGEDPAGDAARALSRRGRQDAEVIATYLARQKPLPALVLCSPARRTRETLNAVLAVLRRPPEIDFEEGLYLADPRRLIGFLRDVDETVPCVLVIGHNPGLQELALRLAVSGPSAARLEEEFPTGALARFESEMPWSEFDRHCARLSLFVTPKTLRPEPD